MGAAGTSTVTIEAYLSDSAYRHCEFVNGSVVELNLGTKQHSRIAGKCFRLLDEYLDKHPVGSAHVELHCKLRIGREVRYRLPDVCLVLSPFDEVYLERSPDLCVEIKSPDDSIGDQLAKFSDYFANGCKLGWLVLPEEETVLVLTPTGGAPKVGRMGDVLDGGEYFPDLRVEVAALFA